MQKSPETSCMQDLYCVNYDRLVSMTRFAATVRAGGACGCSSLPSHYWPAMRVLLEHPM